MGDKMVSKRLYNLVVSLSHCSKDIIDCLTVSTFLYKKLKEISFNLLYTELPLTPSEKRKLKKYKADIRSLSRGKLSKKRLRNLLKTKFLEVITQPIIRMKNGREI